MKTRPTNKYSSAETQIPLDDKEKVDKEKHKTKTSQLLTLNSDAQFQVRDRGTGVRMLRSGCHSAYSSIPACDQTMRGVVITT